MKRIIIILTLIYPIIIVGQYQDGLHRSLFFDRQPSARSEAMGRAYSSILGDISSIYYNPAGIADINGLEINGSLVASPYYSLTNAKYSFICAGFKFNDYLVIGLAYNNFNWGEEISFTDYEGNLLKTIKPYNSNVSLSLSSQPLKNLYVGLNTNYYIVNLFGDVLNTIYLDIGVIKKLDILADKTNIHSLNFGASVTNISYSKISLIEGGTKEALPVISRIGASYKFIIDKGLLFEKLKTFEFLIQGEYQNVFNSAYHSAIRTGGELTFLELLSLRIGYYSETENDYGYPDHNVGEINSITYGFGFYIPINKLTKYPLVLHLDYTNLPQPNYSKDFTFTDNYSNYNLRINWIL